MKLETLSFEEEKKQIENVQTFNFVKIAEEFVSFAVECSRKC